MLSSSLLRRPEMAKPNNMLAHPRKPGNLESTVTVMKTLELINVAQMSWQQC